MDVWLGEVAWSPWVNDCVEECGSGAEDGHSDMLKCDIGIC